MKKPRLNSSFFLVRRFNRQLKRLKDIIQSGDFWNLSQRKQLALVKKTDRLSRIVQAKNNPYKHKALHLALVALLALPVAGQAQTFTLSPESNPLEANYSPNWDLISFADVDGDGDEDLFVGSTEEGSELKFYENQGSTTNPEFVLQGNEANPLGAALDNVVAHFVDIDNDGDLDVFALAYEAAALRFYKNYGDANTPDLEFVPASAPEGVGINTSYLFPAFGDIDNDGDIDLFMTGPYGSTVYYENQGSPEEPEFVEVADLGPFGDLGNISSEYLDFPVLTDIDNDGDLDLVLSGYADEDGNGYKIDVYENTGQPSMAEFSLLTGEDDLFPNVINDYIYPNFVDLDGDGDLDGIFSGYYSGVLYYENNEVSVGIEKGDANVFGLMQNHPNPFYGSTEISFVLDRPSEVKLSVFNLIGQEVAVLANEFYTEGKHELQWDGKNNSGSSLVNGQYIYQLRAGDRVSTKKLSLLNN